MKSKRENRQKFPLTEFPEPSVSNSFSSRSGTPSVLTIELVSKEAREPARALRRKNNIIDANTKFTKSTTTLTMPNTNKPMPQSAPARRRLTCPAGLRPVARVCSLAVANGLHALH